MAESEKYIGTVVGTTALSSADKTSFSNDTVMEVTQKGPGRYLVHVGGEIAEVDAVMLSNDEMSLIRDGRVYDIAFEDERDPNEVLDGRLGVRIDAEVVMVDILDERKHRMRSLVKASGADAGVAKVASPMPGRVMRLEVGAGQSVAAGEALIVVEAMKMENVFKSPIDGVVAEICVSAGDTVNANAVMVIVKSNDIVG